MFRFKNCDYSNSTCEQIGQDFHQGVDFGDMHDFQCHIESHCLGNQCNDGAVATLDNKQEGQGNGNSVSEAAFATTNTHSPSEVEYVVEVEISNEVELEGNEQAQTSAGQSHLISVTMVMVNSVIVCGGFTLRS